MTEQEKAVLRTLWEMRGVLKGLANRMEKELDPLWREYLAEENKPLVHIPSENVAGITSYDTEL